MEVFQLIIFLLMAVVALCTLGAIGVVLLEWIITNKKKGAKRHGIR